MKQKWIDPDEIYCAINRAREHAQANDKPLLMSRVALELGLTSQDLAKLLERLEQKEQKDGGDEHTQAMAHALKMAKQECEADLVDRIADKGNVVGYIFLGKANHGMVETSRQEVFFPSGRFEGEDDLED